ncbi:hypothetical protein SETIT_1G032200v2 [Setaria italica]|uniref:DUF8039 domain-containing protein n=1 Tax=Setaria italica TaxID=4555 RepID=A0A368PHD3_SETIT|nr:hypothetical protein SETIT_1G032200v2 [Setaria italica]
MAQEGEVAASTPQPSATTASGSNPKRQRGKRTQNHIPEKGILFIEFLGSKGEPILPEVIAARFRNICGAIVRDKMETWTQLDVLWAILKEKFTFPEGQEESARKFAEGLLGRCFMNCRSTLNTKYVKKGKNARDDIDRHHLGAGGYAAKIAKWRREEEERRIAGLSDLFEGLDEHSRNWVLARIPTFTPDGKVTFKRPNTDKIYHLQNDQASYRKRDRYKKDLKEKMREIAKQEFLTSQQLQTMTNPIVSDAQRQAEPTLQLAHTGFVAPSSAGSIANVRYPVDDIQVDTPCRLVTTGMEVTDHVFPKELLPEYAWVQVVTVLDESCELDIPIDEGIDVLGDAMIQYILWHRRDIILNNASLKTS